LHRESALRDLFDKFDEDRSGKIDRDELRKMMMILSQVVATLTMTARSMDRPI